MTKRLPEIDSLYKLASLKGSNAKKQFLEDCASDEAFKTALKYLLNTEAWTSGISDKKLSKVLNIPRLNVYRASSLADLLEYLKANSTGRDADVAAVQMFADAYDDETREGVYRVVAQRWSGLGVNTTTANSVYGLSFIPEFKVMLCERYDRDPSYWDDKTFEVDEKLDGFSLTGIKRSGVVELWSRSGKRVEGLIEIEEELRKLPCDNLVFQGERMPMGWQTMTNDEAFALVAVSNRQGDKTGYCFVVYDYVPLADWDKKQCGLTRTERYNQYHSMLAGTKFLQPLKAKYIGSDASVIADYLDEACALKKEGIVVKNVDALYEWDRSKDCVKVKRFKDVDAKITGFDEGSGKHKGTLGSVSIDYKGFVVNVGSGFTDELRKEIWENKSKYLNKEIEVTYFGESKDKDGNLSLRFPTFKTFCDIKY